MTLLDALRLSLPTADRAHHLPIRRAAWAPTYCLIWQNDAWQFSAVSPYGGRKFVKLFDGNPQGALTPTEILESDWGVAL